MLAKTTQSTPVLATVITNKEFTMRRLIFLLAYLTSSFLNHGFCEVNAFHLYTRHLSQTPKSRPANLGLSSHTPTQLHSSLSSKRPSTSSSLSSMASSSDAQTQIQQLRLDSGTKAEIISCIPSLQSKQAIGFFPSLFGNGKNENSKQTHEKPVLTFLHGSFHASWCWEENYMPYFASLGYPCVALSLQGTGGTPALPEGAKKVKVDNHVRDLDAFLRGLSDARSDNANSKYSGLGLGLGENPKVVLIGHSFGGLTIMKWLETFYGEENNAEKESGIDLAGVAFLCSVPPSGNGPMTLRYLFRSFSDSWKITAGFAMKKAINDKDLCRTLFFGGIEDDNGIADEDVERYQSYFARDTVATIDLADLTSKLPSLMADKQSGKAPFVEMLQSKSLVMGASDDFIVDREGLEETAKYMGLESPVIVESPHDIMIGKKWKNGADAIFDWVQKL